MGALEPPALIVIVNMAFVEVKNIKIKGLTVCVPSNVVENSSYTVVPEDERPAFIQAIGIERRRVASSEICTSDLCYKAAENLIGELNWNKDEIDLLVFISQTPDYRMPATSCVLQHRLGLPRTCMTIDISQGCSGYVYGLSVVGSLVSNGSIKKALLLVGNTQNKNVNYNDKSTWPLFSDAGSATAIEYCPEGGDTFKLSYMTDGSGEKTIIIPDGGYRNMVSVESFVEHEYDGGIKRNNLNLFMQGDDVFAFVIGNIPKATKTMYEHFNINPETIDYYLIHHASQFIINKLKKKLGAPDEKVPLILKDFGNSSNASIPIIMAKEIREDVLNRPLQLYISGFGVGLSLGVGVISINKFDCCNLIEY